MMMDVVRDMQIGRNKDRAKAHGVGRGKIARVIFEHGRRCRVKSVSCKDPFKGRSFRLRQKIRMLNAIDCIKQA